MESETARQILSKLIEGLDPDTGKPLPTDSVLHRAPVMRALLAGLSALRLSAARAARRAQLPENVGKSWDDEEEATVVNLFKSGTSLDDIARAHGRTSRSIQLRLEHLGVLRTRSSFKTASDQPTDPQDPGRTSQEDT